MRVCWRMLTYGYVRMGDGLVVGGVCRIWVCLAYPQRVGAVFRGIRQTYPYAAYMMKIPV